MSGSSQQYSLLVCLFVTMEALEPLRAEPFDLEVCDRLMFCECGRSKLVESE